MTGFFVIQSPKVHHYTGGLFFLAENRQKEINWRKKVLTLIGININNAVNQMNAGKVVNPQTVEDLYEQKARLTDEIAPKGFQLVKDNATNAIKGQIIPEMELLIAERLSKLFGDKNSDWERLARSEISMAAERAKLDEWQEWSVQKVEFTPAPDACPICMSVAGTYPIGNAPIPVQNTHPRCRCSSRPVGSEG